MTLFVAPSVRVSMPFTRACLLLLVCPSTLMLRRLRSPYPGWFLSPVVLPRGVRFRLFASLVRPPTRIACGMPMAHACNRGVAGGMASGKRGGGGVSPRSSLSLIVHSDCTIRTEEGGERVRPVQWCHIGRCLHSITGFYC